MGEAPGVDEVRGWKGFKLDDVTGAPVGKVEGAYVDADDGSLHWLLAQMGRFGHHCLIPAGDAVAAGGHVWVPYGRDQIRKAPRQEPGEPLEREAEQALLGHFGVGAGEGGRAAALEKRDAGAVTAQPV
jgi:hypothetical protein